jgi:kumamolisin
VSLESVENSLTSDVVASVDQKLPLLTQAEHMTIFVTSGDCGAFMDHVLGDHSVSFPATDPHVIAVGGTELSVDADHNRRKEVVWSDGSDRSKCTNQWGSGGGLNTRFKQPDWQRGTGVNNQDSNGFRQIPAVAAVAFHLPIYFQGQWRAVNGTSAATPIWAAGFAPAIEGVLEQTNTFFYGPDTFYAVANTGNGATPYSDVTQGDNLHYAATDGWDAGDGTGQTQPARFLQDALSHGEASVKAADNAATEVF